MSESAGEKYYWEMPVNEKRRDKSFDWRNSLGQSYFFDFYHESTTGRNRWAGKSMVAMRERGSVERLDGGVMEGHRSVVDRAVGCAERVERFEGSRGGRLVCAQCDCMEVLRALPDGCFDLAIVDPPYGGGVPHIHRPRKDVKVSFQHRYDPKAIQWDVAPGEEYFRELLRVSKHQIVWGGNYFSDKLPASPYFIIYRKPTVMEKFTMAMCEYAWTSCKVASKIFEHDRYVDDRWHPTQKPVALNSWLLFYYGAGVKSILDTHGGSFSLGKACLDDGAVDYLGLEVDGKYYERSMGALGERARQGILL